MPIVDRPVHDECFMSLPQAICNYLDELGRTLNSSWAFDRVKDSGLSVSSVYRITFSRDRFALRDWSWTSQRKAELASKLEFQHRLATDWIVDRSGLLLENFSTRTSSPIPSVCRSWAEGQAIAISNDSLWSLCGWVPGNTVRSTRSVTPAQLNSVAAVLGRCTAFLQSSS